MPYGVVNKSGCVVRKGNCQIRLDFYLELEDPRYSDRYLYLVNEISPEYLAGYPGKVDKDGIPIDQADYGKWLESLPHIWKNTPFHSHFIYLPSGFAEQDIKAAIGLHLPNFYQAFQERQDEVAGGMRHGWATETRINPTDYSKIEVPGKYSKRVSDCQAAIDGLVAFQYKPDGEIKGQTFPATEIDVGSAAIDRASYDLLTYAALEGVYTLIDYNNPANAEGTIDTVEAYFNAVDTGSIFRVGTFIDKGSASFTCHDGYEIGVVSGTGYKSYTGLDLDVSPGEYIGADGKTGAPRNFYIDCVTSGGSGIYRKDYAAACDPSDTYTFDLRNSGIVSLYGTGKTAVAFQPFRKYYPHILAH